MGNRISRKTQRNAADAVAQQTDPIPSSNPRFEIRKVGDRFIPWDTLTRHTPLGYDRGYPDIPTCQRVIEQSLALNF